jgi:hypothetical protein
LYSILDTTRSYKDDGGFIDARWFDEGRLIILGEGIHQKDVVGEENGVDFAVPIK